MRKYRKIMLIDDDPDHQKIFGNLLEMKGYVVFRLLGCEDLQDLVRMVLSFQPNLIFMEHAMPNVCGIDAAHTLRSYPVTKNIPIIYFTGHDDIKSLADMAGADAFLKKPYEMNDVNKILGVFA